MWTVLSCFFSREDHSKHITFSWKILSCAATKGAPANSGVSLFIHNVLDIFGEGLNRYTLYRNYRQNVLFSSEVTTEHINETKTLTKLYLILKCLTCMLKSNIHFNTQSLLYRTAMVDLILSNRPIGFHSLINPFAAKLFQIFNPLHA